MLEKSRQRRSRHFAVLTYSMYAPRVKMAAALLEDFFEHSLQLMRAVSSWACICHGNAIFNSPKRALVHRQKAIQKLDGLLFIYSLLFRLT
jgi:hypothetical protein